jgi:hypothetical protein
MTERKNGRFVGVEKTTVSGTEWHRPGRKTESEMIALDRILGGFSFPASKEDITRQLAIDAFAQDGGRAADLHDLVVQLDVPVFQSLDELRKGIKERHVWEKTHDMLA